MKDGPIGASHGQARWRNSSQPLKLGQSARIGKSITAAAHREIVTAQLALIANPIGDQPHHRVVEKKCFHDHLQDVHKVVITADMRQFMGEQGFQLPGCQPHSNGCRQKNDRTNPADDGRHFCNRRHQHPKLLSNSQAFRQTCNHGLNRGVRLDAAPTQRRRVTPSPCQPQCEYEHACSPQWKNPAFKTSGQCFR
jgi:hypothetical protein